MQHNIAIIGGSGLSDLFVQEQSPYCPPVLKDLVRRVQEVPVIITPYGNVEGIVEWVLNHDDAQRVFFIPRHGVSHSLPPHAINYRANIAALSQLEVKHIVATNAVGGIGELYAPKKLAIPSDLIDYTSAREHTFFDSFSKNMQHIDFTWPFDGEMREALIKAAAGMPDVIKSGVYACTQGPRLETAAEIKKFSGEGCTLVGMTAMPEAALARELDIDYASVCLIVNWAAGLQSTSITMEDIHEALIDTRETTLLLISKTLGLVLNKT